MHGEEAPISAKERIARFQNLINNANSANNSAPVFNITPKTTPFAPMVQTQPVSPPPSRTGNSQKQGQVESPSIVKPSAGKNMFSSNTLNLQSNLSNNMSSQPSVNPVVQSPPKPSFEFKGSSMEVSEGKGIDNASVLSVNALKMMMEGKNINLNQPLQYSNPNRVSVPRVDEKDIVIDGSTGQRATSTIEANATIGKVKDNAKILNLFFQSQRQSEKIKTEEQQNLKNNQNEEVPLKEKPKELISGGQGEKQEAAQEFNNAQNISAGQEFYVPPELRQGGQGSTPKESGAAEQVGSQEGNVMARLQKRKKQSKKGFSSDSD